MGMFIQTTIKSLIMNELLYKFEIMLLWYSCSLWQCHFCFKVCYGM